MSAPTLTAERIAEYFDVPEDFITAINVPPRPLPQADPQVDRETVAADLLATAEVLERDGWFQGEYHCAKPEGGISHCTLGAIGIATGYWIPGPPPELSPEELEGLRPAELLYHTNPDEHGRTRFWRANEFMRDYLKEFGLHQYGDVADWNDETEGLTGEIVAGTVRAAAEWVASR